MGDRECGSIMRDWEVLALDFDLNASEFHRAEWVQEDDEVPSLTAARLLGQAVADRHHGLVLHFVPTADHPREICEYVHL